MYHCPLSCSCDGKFESWKNLNIHWTRMHSRCHGPMKHVPTNYVSTEATEATAAASSTDPIPPASCLPNDVTAVTMAHINKIKFKHYATDADAARVKAAIRDCLQTALSGGAGGAGDDCQSLAGRVITAFDKINSKRREATAREKASAHVHPPLKVYARSLGIRGLGKRKRLSNNEAFAYDTKWEEVLEREFAYDPQFIAEVVLAHEHWRRRSSQIRSSDWRDPERTFDDICDGQAWQEHPFLGDPAYDGPARIAFEGYCDDVDVPNPIGTAAGHHKLYISFFTVLNRPPKTRATLHSVHLATICLASDFKIFGPQKVISGTGFDNSVGGTMRRFDAGVTLRTPAASGMESLPARGWLAVWTADGLAQGEIYGTNASFSKAINPCNLCEDLDQRTPAGRKPCGFLVCTCKADQPHVRGCKCHFQLRTPKRDAARTARGRMSRDEMQKLGIVRLDHGFVDIPYFHVARPGPKEPMHMWWEGRTKNLAAYTCWSIAHSGLATPAQIREHAQQFDWSPGDSAPAGTRFFRPHYIPESVFTSTQVPQDDKSWVWGPHKDAKLPFSAAGMVTFTVMSIAFFSRFIPSSWTLSSCPAWWKAWVLHANAACATLCYHFTFADLTRLERLIVDSEETIAAHPPYAHVWIPKGHWILHTAHDIWRWGPSRLLWVMLKEMKNAAFKRGCARSNFHNPVKSAATFWCEQSDWQCQQADFSRCACSNPVVLAEGTVAGFPDSEPLALLLQHDRVQLDLAVQFLSALEFHGVPVPRCSGVLVDGSLYFVERLLACGGQYYVWLRLLAAELTLNSFGHLIARPASIASSSRLLNLHHGSDLTPVYMVRNGDALLVIVRF